MSAYMRLGRRKGADPDLRGPNAVILGEGSPRRPPKAPIPKDRTRAASLHVCFPAATRAAGDPRTRARASRFSGPSRSRPSPARPLNASAALPGRRPAALPARGAWERRDPPTCRRRRRRAGGVPGKAASAAWAPEEGREAGGRERSRGERRSQPRLGMDRGGGCKEGAGATGGLTGSASRAHAWIGAAPAQERDPPRGEPRLARIRVAFLGIRLEGICRCLSTGER